MCDGYNQDIFIVTFILAYTKSHMICEIYAADISKEIYLFKYYRLQKKSSNQARKTFKKVIPQVFKNCMLVQKVCQKIKKLITYMN